jgi:hypothetical protein
VASGQGFIRGFNLEERRGSGAGSGENTGFQPSKIKNQKSKQAEFFCKNVNDFKPL